MTATQIAIPMTSMAPFFTTSTLSEATKRQTHLLIGSLSPLWMPFLVTSYVGVGYWMMGRSMKMAINAAVTEPKSVETPKIITAKVQDPEPAVEKEAPESLGLTESSEVVSAMASQLSALASHQETEVAPMTSEISSSPSAGSEQPLIDQAFEAKDVRPIKVKPTHTRPKPRA